MGHVVFHPKVTLGGTQISAHVPDSLDAPLSRIKATRLGQQHERPRQSTKSRFPGVQKSYLLLTFMLPKADGCGTGLQLSAKEVVLGRPDIFQSEVPRVSQSKIRSVVLNESVSTRGKQFASDLNNKENGAKATRLSAIVFFSELSSAFRSFSSGSLFCDC